MWRNQVKRLRFHEVVKLGFFTAITFFFFIGLYVGFLRILAYLETVPLLGKTLILKLVAMIFLLFFLMLIFSSLLTALTTFFFGRDLSFLFSCPLSPRTLFLFKFAQTIFYSSWMVWVTLLPFFLAYGRVEKLGFAFYPTIFLLSLPFFLIAGSIGVVLSLFLVYFFPSPRLRNIFFVFFVILGGVIYLIIRLLQPEQLANPDKLTEVIQYLTFIQAPTAVYLPSWWITGAINAYATANFADFRFYALVLCGCGLIFFFLVCGLAQNMYGLAWVNLQGTGLLRRIPGKIAAARGNFRLFRKWRLLSQPVLLKDVKTFFRDTNQWTQVFLLLPLLGVYLFNLYRLPLDTFYLKSLVAFLNIGLAGFVLAAVALRFVFPAISLEGQNFWILRSAPISLAKIVRTKFLLTLLPLVFFAVLISLFSNLLLKVDLFVFLFSTAVILIFALTLSGLGIGLGTAYPKFKVENIPQIETSAGGILYILAALFYIGLSLSILAWPMRMYFYQKMGKLNPFDYPVIFWVVFSFLLLSLLTLFLPILWGLKKINNLEE